MNGTTKERRMVGARARIDDAQWWLTGRATSLAREARFRLRAAAERGDRGDIPGWVMVTLMTAGLVSAVYLVAKPQLQGLFRDAISGVKGNTRK